MESLRKTIIAKTAEWVWQLGADHFTLDELAGTLHLSKKTIYKHVESKQELVREAVLLLLTQQQGQLAMIRNLAENALQEVVWTGDYLAELWQTVSPNFLQDLQHTHSGSYQAYGHTMEVFVQCHLSRGIDEGYFRSDVPMNLSTSLAYGQFEYAFRVHRYLWVQMPLSLTLTLYYYHFYLGICTPQGHGALAALMVNQAGAGRTGFQLHYG